MKNLLRIAIGAAIIAFATLNPTRSKAQIDVSDPIKESVVRQLLGNLDPSGHIHVIVGVKADFVPEGLLENHQLAVQRSSIRDAQQRLVKTYKSIDTSQLKIFDYIPYLAFEADKEILEAMISDNQVTFVQEDEASAPALAESIPIVNAPAAWSAGYSGSGQLVAIVDSGVDKTHSFLAGKVISEACYSSINASSTSVCPGGVTASTADGSGINCLTSISGCDHGTHVAGIAAGKSATINGVAKDAGIIAIQIFSSFTTSASCGSVTPCARYWTSDLIKGLERVKTLSATMSNIAAVNLSLQTGQQYTNSCDVEHSATKAAIDNLRSSGIPTVVCAGNYSFTNALTAPACISTSVSVGSVDDGSLGTGADVVSSFSDSSPLLHLLAPGRWINSSVPGNGFANFSGTSMATPHVVGAIAVMRQRNSAASIPRMLNAMIASGTRITDARNSLSKPRLNVGAAVNLVVKNTAADYDGDGKTDISVFRPLDGNWYLNNSLDGISVVNWGNSTDVPTPGDFDNDGKTDVAVYRPSTGQWFILNSSNSSFVVTTWGNSTDRPVTADYDGDDKADIAVYRASTGEWFILRSSNGAADVIQWGAATDLTVPEDYDGDGKADIAVYRPSNGTWFVLQSTGGGFGIPWGTAGDKPVPGDYDGDGRDDIAQYRPSDGNWYFLKSGTNNTQYGIVNWGNVTDMPVPGDYDGDGTEDVAVYRPSTGDWFVLKSTSGYLTTNWGAAGDQPVPASYVP